MAGIIHVGNKIAELLEEQHRSKRDLGLDLGMSQGNVGYLTRRESIDVQMLQKIGNNLKYNFWKQFPIDDGSVPKGIFGMSVDEAATKDNVIGELNAKIAELNEKVAEKDKRIEELTGELVKQENGFLKEINSLLKKK